MGTAALLGIIAMMIFGLICGIVSLIPTFCVVFAILFWGSLPIFAVGVFFNLTSGNKSVLFTIGSVGLMVAAVVFGVTYVAEILRSFVEFITPGNCEFVPLSAELLFFPWR